MRKLAEGEDVEVNVTIEEEACLDLMNGAQGIVAQLVSCYCRPPFLVS